MMRSFKLNFEFSSAPWRRNALGQTAFFEHFQSAKDGHFANAFAFERLVHILHRDMLFGVKQKIDDLFTLIGKTKSLFDQVLLKHFLDARRIPFATGGPGWKKNEFFGWNRHSLIEILFQ